MNYNYTARLNEGFLLQTNKHSTIARSYDLLQYIRDEYTRMERLAFVFLSLFQFG